MGQSTGQPVVTQSTASGQYTGVRHTPSPQWNGQHTATQSANLSTQQIPASVAGGHAAQAQTMSSQTPGQLHASGQMPYAPAGYLPSASQGHLSATGQGHQPITGQGSMASQQGYMPVSSNSLPNKSQYPGQIPAQSYTGQASMGSAVSQANSNSSNSTQVQAQSQIANSSGLVQGQIQGPGSHAGNYQSPPVSYPGPGVQGQVAYGVR